MIVSASMQNSEEIRRLELMRFGGRSSNLQASIPVPFGYDLAKGQAGISLGGVLHVPVHSTLHPSFGVAASLYYPGLTAAAMAAPPHLHIPGPLRLALTRGLVQSTGPDLDFSEGRISSSKLSTISSSTQPLPPGGAPLVHNQELQEKYDHENELPSDFKPGPNSVIIGRKKNCYTSVGNLRLRDICLLRLPAYSKCGKKKDKSEIVTSIVKIIRDSCPHGGAFVKNDYEGKWHEVKDVVARERVASIFRDFLHDQYRSSSKSKVAKRREKRTTQCLTKPSSSRSGKTYDEDQEGDDTSEASSRGEDEESDQES